MIIDENKCEGYDLQIFDDNAMLKNFEINM